MGSVRQLEEADRKISELEVRILTAMKAQTRWMLGGLAVLGTVFKLADVLIK